MPKVGKEQFAYTPKGIKAAKEYSEETDMPITNAPDRVESYHVGGQVPNDWAPKPQQDTTPAISGPIIPPPFETVPTPQAEAPTQGPYIPPRNTEYGEILPTPQAPERSPDPWKDASPSRDRSFQPSWGSVGRSNRGGRGATGQQAPRGARGLLPGLFPPNMKKGGKVSKRKKTKKG